MLSDISNISNYFYIVSEDYLIRLPKKEKFKRKPRKVEPILKGKILGNNVDVYS